MKTKEINNKGMTLPEMILAISMLIAFTGIAVMVTSYTARFFQPLNVEINEENPSSNNEFRDMANKYIQNYINYNLSLIKDDKGLIEVYLNFINEKNDNYFFKDARNIVLNEDFKVAKIEENYQFRNFHFNFSSTINFLIGIILGFIISFILSFFLESSTKKIP